MLSEVGVEAVERFGHDGKDAFVASFPAHFDRAVLTVDISELEPGDFDTAEPLLEHQNHDESGSSVGAGEDRFLGLVASERAGQRFGLAWPSNVGCDVLSDVIAPFAPSEE
jgi:hypothetical protein